MGVFLRGNVWWMEYRTRKVRKVISTGFRKDQKAKAVAAYQAFRLGMGARPKRSAMEGILSAIYDTVRPAHGIALSSLQGIYDDWSAGKGRKVARLTEVNRRNLLARFVEWAAGRGLTDVSDVSVAVARDYVVSLRDPAPGKDGKPRPGKSNKTLRTYCQYLSSIWKAAGQMTGGMSNPWLAACPDPDGSSVRREAFSPAEERRVLDAARKAGHGWWLASMIARWTGLRYGDVATLEWGDAEDALRAPVLPNGVVDLDRRLIVIDPSKTRRHGLRVSLPLADPLRAALASVPPGKREGFVLPEHGIKYPQPFDAPFSDVLKAAGLDPVRFTFHSWRHTFRTRLAEAGVPDQVAMRFGWTNLPMSRHYDHAKHLPEMREAVERLAVSAKA